MSRDAAEPTPTTPSSEEVKEKETEEEAVPEVAEEIPLDPPCNNNLHLWIILKVIIRHGLERLQTQSRSF